MNANHTDPLVGDGFQSQDAEVDAIGAILPPFGIPPVPQHGFWVCVRFGRLHPLGSYPI